MEFMIDENLLEIFSNLDSSSLLNASLVCKRWEELISTSAFLMRNFDLMISFNSNKFKVQNVFPNGKYRNLTLTADKFCVLVPEGVKIFIKSKNECLRNITLGSFDKFKSIQVLSCLSNVTKLIISNFQNKTLSNEVANLPNLRHLELNNSVLFENVLGRQSIRILKIFGTAGDADRTGGDYVAAVNKLLKKCSNLKDLTLSNIQIRNLNLKTDFFEFNLETLTIESFNYDEENLVEFLVKHKNSLKKLTFSSLQPKIIIPVIIFNQLTLDELEIDVGLIPKTFNSGINNSTIKKLTIRYNKQPIIRPQRRPVMPRPVAQNRDLFGGHLVPIERPNIQNDPLYHFQMYQERQQLYRNQEQRIMDQNQQIGQYVHRFPLQQDQQDDPDQPEDPNQQLHRVESEQKSKAAEKIILACKSVESFMILDFTFDSLLQQLNWAQTNLKILKLQKIPKVISPIIQFDKLEFIEIDKIESGQDVENLIFLVLYSPNLLTIKINSFPSKYFESKFFVTIVNKAKNLREIHIGTKCRFTSDMVDAVKMLKCRGRPLKVLSFDYCSTDEKAKNEFKFIFMEDLKLNFHSNSTKFFSSMIKETQLGRMKREIDDKHADLKQQEYWSVFREEAVESYEYYNSAY